VVGGGGGGGAQLYYGYDYCATLNLTVVY